MTKPSPLGTLALATAALLTTAVGSVGLISLPADAHSRPQPAPTQRLVDTVAVEGTGGPEVSTSAKGSLTVTVERRGELTVRAAYRDIVIQTSPGTPTKRHYRLVVRADGKIIGHKSGILRNGRVGALGVKDKVKTRGVNIVSAALQVQDRESRKYVTIDSSLGLSFRGASTSISPNETNPDTAYATVPLDEPNSGTLEAFGEREPRTGSNVAVTVRVTSTSDLPATYTFMLQPDQTVRRTVTVAPNSTEVVRFEQTANGPTRVENVTVYATDAEGVSVASPLDLLFFD